MTAPRFAKTRATASAAMGARFDSVPRSEGYDAVGRRVWTDLELEVIDDLLKRTAVYDVALQRV